MPKHRHRSVMMEGLIMPTKIRKRGCSSSSSSSSRIRHYRLSKRAILVGKSRAGLGIGLGGSRSSTPVPTWRSTPLRTAIDSPKYSQSGKSTQPVTARRLAATLWEMNEIPSPKVSERNLELMKQNQKKNGSKIVLKREKSQSGWGLHSSSGSLPPHLSDPPHSPSVSEKLDRTRLSNRPRTSLNSQRLRPAEQNAAVFDAISSASLMEIDTRSRPPTSSGSICGSTNRLKEVSNALTTSKELLKIINRVWAQADQPSSSMSVISALHAELERARLQVNRLIQEQRYDKNEITHLMKLYADEKTSWKNKENQAIEAAIASIASELEAERKLRRRVECLNKKLGQDLAEIKSAFVKSVKELEREKRAREITEQVCDELARNINETKEAGKEKEIKPHEARHQVDEKNSAFGKLRKQLEVFLGSKRDKDEERGTCLSKSIVSSYQNGQEDDKEVDDAIDNKEDTAESDDCHLIEPNTNNANRTYRWTHEIRARNSISDQVSRRSTSLQRAASDDVEWGTRGTSQYITEDGSERQGEKEANRRSYYEKTQRYKPVKGLFDHVLSSPRLSSSRDPLSTIQERHSGTHSASSKSRVADVGGEGLSTRRSKC